MSKFKAGDRAAFNCAYAYYSPGDEVVVTGVSDDYTYYRAVKDGKTGSCYHHRLDEVVDAPMLPLTRGREPETGEQVLSRADKWLTENGYSGWGIDTVLLVARFLREVDSSQ